MEPPISWVEFRCFDGRYSPVSVLQFHDVVLVSTRPSEVRLNVTSPSQSNAFEILEVFFRRLSKAGVLFWKSSEHCRLACIVLIMSKDCQEKDGAPQYWLYPVYWRCASYPFHDQSINIDSCPAIPIMGSPITSKCTLQGMTEFAFMSPWPMMIHSWSHFRICCGHRQWNPGLEGGSRQWADLIAHCESMSGFSRFRGRVPGAT